MSVLEIKITLDMLMLISIYVTVYV